MNLFEGFEGLGVFSLSSGQIVKNLLVALAGGLGTACFYYLNDRQGGRSKSFVSALIALSMITAMVIMAIENNLARAFGLVGAMSIIRFRTAVKDVYDILFIYFALGVGMAAGVGLAALVAIATPMIGLVMYLAAGVQALSLQKRGYLLQFSCAAADDEAAPYLPLLERHCRKYRLINVKTLGNEDLLEIAYYITPKSAEQNRALVSELGRLEGIGNVNLFFDEEYD